MFGKWAYGFWQCKNKYQSQAELLGVAKKYRDLHIPVDNIVQDWFWWTRKGEHVFNNNYPDPKGMVDELHRENFHLMISVWPFYDPGSDVYAEMDKRGYLIERTKVGGFHPQGMAIYDAMNPKARAYYWNLMDGPLFKIGADAWWLDTDEPETEGREEGFPRARGVRVERLRKRQRKARARTDRCYPAMGRRFASRRAAASRHGEIRRVHAGAGTQAPRTSCAERRDRPTLVVTGCRALSRATIKRKRQSMKTTVLRPLRITLSSR